MKDNSIINIGIAFSCQEEWHKMKGDGRKRFCEKCSSNVHDFTESTTEKLNEILNNSSGLACGKFKRSQLNESFFKYAASTLILTASISLTVLGQETGRADSVLKSSEQVGEEVLIGTIIEDQAIPCSGSKRFIDKIYKELDIPENLTKGGNVFVQFIVTTDGNITDVKVIKGLNKIVDEEAVRTLLAIDEKFEPATQRGKAVSVRMVLPITFDPKKRRN